MSSSEKVNVVDLIHLLFSGKKVICLSDSGSQTFFTHGRGAIFELNIISYYPSPSHGMTVTRNK